MRSAEDYARRDQVTGEVRRRLLTKGDLVLGVAGRIVEDAAATSPSLTPLRDRLIAGYGDLHPLGSAVRTDDVGIRGRAHIEWMKLRVRRGAEWPVVEQEFKLAEEDLGKLRESPLMLLLPCLAHEGRARALIRLAGAPKGETSDSLAEARKTAYFQTSGFQVDLTECEGMLRRGDVINGLDRLQSLTPPSDYQKSKAQRLAREFPFPLR